MILTPERERERVEKNLKVKKVSNLIGRRRHRPNCDVKSTKQEKQIIFRKVKKQFKIFSCLIHKVSNIIKIPHLL